MKAVIDLAITLTLLLGSGAIAKKVYKEVQVIAVKRIQKGLSSSEKLAQQLTGEKLDF